MEKSLQSIFEQMVSGVLRQGCRSTDDGQCLYRGDNGTKCAVGQILTDEQMERFKIENSWGLHMFPSELIDELVPGNDFGSWKGWFLASVQQAHDRSCSSGKDFRLSFFQGIIPIARIYSLSLSFVSSLGFFSEEEIAKEIARHSALPLTTRIADLP